MNMREEFNKFIKAEADAQWVSGDEYAMSYLAFKEAWNKRVPDVDWLADILRKVDGNHSLGAGALAEKIVEAMIKAGED